MSTNFLRLYKFLFRPSTFQVKEVRDKHEEVFEKAVAEDDVGDIAGDNLAPTDVVGLSDPISLTYSKICCAVVKNLWRVKCRVQFHQWIQ